MAIRQTTFSELRRSGQCGDCWSRQLECWWLDDQLRHDDREREHYGSGATLTINGTNANNVLTVKEDGSGNVTYKLDGDPAVQIPAATAIIFNAGDGDGQLVVDYSPTVTMGGFFTNAITYNGGTQTTTGGDTLTFNANGATVITSVVHTFTNASDGTVTVTDNAAATNVITYTGLEPIADNINAANRTFTFNGGGETISLTDSGGRWQDDDQLTVG